MKNKEQTIEHFCNRFKLSREDFDKEFTVEFVDNCSGLSTPHWCLEPNHGE